MSDVKLSDKDWQKIEGFLGEHKGVYLGAACRRLFEGVKWMGRSGAPCTMAVASGRVWELESCIQAV